MSRATSRGKTDFTNGQNIINVKALEQGPHGEVDIYQPPPKVQASGEPGNNLETCLGPVAFGGSIQTDNFTRARSREGKNLGNLKGVGLDVLGKSGPGEGKVVPHEIINRISRYQS